MLVQKYGGSSLTDETRRQRVVDRIAEAWRSGRRPVVVVSAMGRKGDPYATDTLIDLMRDAGDRRDLRELDLIMSCGEIISACVMSQTLNANGVPALALTGAQAGIFTEAAQGQARIARIEPERIVEETRKRVVIIAGFQGITSPVMTWGEVTTLGRGGSDTTAVALAVALEQPECEIYTDVDGIYTSDPRMVNEARILRDMSYEEALELATHGGKVVHARAIELAYTHGVRILIANSQNKNPGTWIGGSSLEITNRVTNVSLEKGLALITLANVPNVSGVAERVVKPLLDHKIPFKLLQSGSVFETAMMSFQVGPEDFQQALPLLQEAARDLEGTRVSSRDHIARVSVIGTGIGHPEYLMRVLHALKEANANNYQIEAFESRISCYIDDADVARAGELLHEIFELGAK
jgi:aspartate kinase